MHKRSECAVFVASSSYPDAVRLMIRIMRRHHACVERRIGDMGIHHSQHRMLMHLARKEADIPSQKELAKDLGISAAAVATTLKRLEKEGYIARTITDSDNRRNEIHITEEGLSKVTEGREILESTDRSMFEGFTPEELSAFTAYLRRINQNLDAAGVPADPPCNHPHSPRTRKEETT